eukprot:COSAG01_NODE_6757_length_3512_cov_2.511280_2_plen_42_part_00
MGVHPLGVAHARSAVVTKGCAGGRGGAVGMGYVAHGGEPAC